MANKSYKYQIRFKDEYGHTHERNIIAKSFKEAWLEVFIQSLSENILPAELELDSNKPVSTQ